MEGTGVVYGGNNMCQFGAGDTIIFGANVPHLLKNAQIYYTDASPGVLSHTLFLDAKALSEGLFSAPELIDIRALLIESERGIIIQNELLNSAIQATSGAKGYRLILALFDILVQILEAEKTYINDKTYRLSIDDSVGDRLNDILAYTFEHLDSKITIAQVAAIAHLSKSQFARYFKMHTGKSFIRFLNDLRIETACDLLKEGSDHIGMICYKVGFQNVSNFNRIFKTSKGVSPREYRTQYTR